MSSTEAMNIYLQKLSSEVKNLHQALSSQLIPKSQQVHRHVREFLLTQVKDFESVNNKNDQVLDQLRQELDYYNKKVGETKSKKSKDSKFIEGGTGYLQSKDKQIKAKGKVLQSINTGLKQSVSKVDPLKLAQLNYKKQPILHDIFSTLFGVLYNENKQKFEWETFKNLALKHENGQDFITRLANFNFKEMSDTYYDELRMLQNDPKFKDTCENSKLAIIIVDLADWLDYVIEGHKVYNQKKVCESDYQKIRKDIDRRSDGTTQLNEQFCVETLKDIDHYQTNLMNLQSELQTIIIGMNQNVSQLKQIEAKRAQKIHAINSL